MKAPPAAAVTQATARAVNASRFENLAKELHDGRRFLFVEQSTKFRLGQADQIVGGRVDQFRDGRLRVDVIGLVGSKRERRIKNGFLGSRQ